jgi:hypothetical protein
MGKICDHQRLQFKENTPGRWLARNLDNYNET